MGSSVGEAVPPTRVTRRAGLRCGSAGCGNTVLSPLPKGGGAAAAAGVVFSCKTELGSNGLTTSDLLCPTPGELHAAGSCRPAELRSVCPTPSHALGRLCARSGYWRRKMPGRVTDENRNPQTRHMRSCWALRESWAQLPCTGHCFPTGRDMRPSS